MLTNHGTTLLLCNGKTSDKFFNKHSAILSCSQITLYFTQMVSCDDTHGICIGLYSDCLKLSLTCTVPRAVKLCNWAGELASVPP